MLVTLADFLECFADRPAAPDLIPRTVRRASRRYAAIVAAPRGQWNLGEYPTRTQAGDAAHAFVLTGPVEPAPDAPPASRPANWTPKRSDSHAPSRKWCRRVRGNAWQARVWLGKAYGSLNLGLFTVAKHGEFAEWAAAQVSRAFVREWRAGRTVGEVVEQLKVTNKATERVRTNLVVPESQRDLRPPSPPAPRPETGRTKTERRRIRDRGLVNLADLLAVA